MITFLLISFLFIMGLVAGYTLSNKGLNRVSNTRFHVAADPYYYELKQGNRRYLFTEEQLDVAFNRALNHDSRK